MLRKTKYSNIIEILSIYRSWSQTFFFFSAFTHWYDIHQIWHGGHMTSSLQTRCCCIQWCRIEIFIKVMEIKKFWMSIVPKGGEDQKRCDVTGGVMRVTHKTPCNGNTHCTSCKYASKTSLLFWLGNAATVKYFPQQVFKLLIDCTEGISLTLQNDFFGSQTKLGLIVLWNITLRLLAHLLYECKGEDIVYSASNARITPG